MTTAADRPVTPYRPQAAPGRDGFAQLVHAEWTKFRTVRGWLAGMVIAIVAMAGLGIFIAAGGGVSCQVNHGPVMHGAACEPPVVLGPGGEPVTDSFYFVRQPLSGNGSITVQVTSLTGLLPAGGGSSGGPAPTRPGLMPWSKTGIIIKANLTQGSAYAAMMVTGGNGVRMQWNYTGDTAGLPGPVSAASPRWLKLTRDGDVITGYDSADGVHWTTVGVVRLAGLSSTVQAGLFAASPSAPPTAVNITGTSQGGGAGQTTATTVLDHVSRSGAWPSGTWNGGFLPSGSGSGVPGMGGYQQAAGRFTVTGTGDIAPAVPGQDVNTGGPTGLTAAIFLIGTFLGLIVVAVVATMFMTAEYRRGLIRTTLAASPRRGRVLAAKALVAGAVAFVAGLLGAAGALLIGLDIAHSLAYSVFPEPWPAQLRMIVGTAALVAVTAAGTVAVAAIVRRSVAAVTIVVAALVVPYFLAAIVILPAGVADWLLRVTPAAAFAVQQAVPRYPQVDAYYAPVAGFYPLAWWAGLAVLCGWALAAFGAAVYLLRRRDM